MGNKVIKLPRSNKKVEVINPLVVDEIDAQLERLELPFDCSSMWAAFIAQCIYDALIPDDKVASDVSSRKFRNEARDWWFSDDPDVVENREWILTIGCGYDEPAQKVEYVRELIHQKATVKDYKKDMGIKR